MKYKSIYNRLRRIEGQVRGVEEMINKDEAEKNILIQLEALKSSLSSTIGAFLAEIVSKKRADDGSYSVDEEWLNSIMRFIKKS